LRVVPVDNQRGQHRRRLRGHGSQILQHALHPRGGRVDIAVLDAVVRARVDKDAHNFQRMHLHLFECDARHRELPVGHNPSYSQWCLVSQNSGFQCAQRQIDAANSTTLPSGWTKPRDSQMMLASCVLQCELEYAGMPAQRYRNHTFIGRHPQASGDLENAICDFTF
jgi:hypothetical protein